MNTDNDQLGLGLNTSLGGAPSSSSSSKPAAAGDGRELHELNKTELRDRLDELGLSLPSRATKDELIEAIEEADNG